MPLLTVNACFINHSCLSGLSIYSCCVQQIVFWFNYLTLSCFFQNPLGNPEFSIQFDMRDFRAEDISLSTKNGKLIINGKNEIDILDASYVLWL